MSTRSRTFLLLTLSILALANTGCSRILRKRIQSRNRNNFTASYNERESTLVPGLRVLDITLTALSPENAEISMSSYASHLNQKSEANVERKLICEVTKSAPSCTLSMPLNTGASSSTPDSWYLSVDIKHKRLFGGKSYEYFTYHRADIAEVDANKVLKCSAGLQCNLIKSATGVALTAKATESSVTLRSPLTTDVARAGARGLATLTIDPGAAFARLPTSALTYSGGYVGSREVQVPLTVQVGSRAQVTGNLLLNTQLFLSGVRDALAAKKSPPRYLNAPSGKSRRGALLFVSGTPKVLGSPSTFDDIDVFAVAENDEITKVSCGQYTGQLTGNVTTLTGESISRQVTVIERGTGTVLGTKTFKPIGSPCAAETKSGITMRIYPADDLLAKYALSL
jgi:hypothetical protein